MMVPETTRSNKSVAVTRTASDMVFGIAGMFVRCKPSNVDICGRQRVVTSVREVINTLSEGTEGNEVEPQDHSGTSENKKKSTGRRASKQERIREYRSTSVVRAILLSIALERPLAV